MVNQVLQALEGEAGGDVVPAVVQSVDSVVLHAPVLHRQRVRACAHEADFIFPLYPQIPFLSPCGPVVLTKLQKTHFQPDFLP